MNKWIRRTLNLLLFGIAFNTLEHTCHKLTDGFSISRIQFASMEKSLPDTSDTHSFALLQQPFRYLDCGNQCYAFVSDDGKYVLKFFKYARHSPPVWTARIPLLNRIKSFRPHRIHKVAWKRDRDFQGYRLAFDRFREQAGLLCLHLDPASSGYPTITLYDKLGIRHILDLNTTPFVLQKKASPVYSQFFAWLQTGDIDKVRAGLSHLIALCSERLSRRIFDDDVHFYSNFGFVGETPIQIDPGHFVLSPSPLPSSELELLTVELQVWFSKHYPILVPYVEACAKSH